MVWVVGGVFGAWAGGGLPGWLAVAWRAGRGGGSWAGGPLCGLRCGAQPWGGGAETRCALPWGKAPLKQPRQV